MTIIRKILAFTSIFAVFGFAQEFTVISDSAAAAIAIQDSIAKTIDSTKVTAQDTAKVAEVPKDTLKADSTSADTAAPKKPRNKITYQDYQKKVIRAAKKRSKTLHHGLSIVSANYHDKNYWHMDHDATWGMGMGMYYFYRRYIGNYIGVQGRLGALYRYSRWSFDADEQEGTLSTGEDYSLVHHLDRKYFNFSADMPLTAKFGHHIKGTTSFIFSSLTFGLTKPIYEMTDTENSLYLKTKDKDLKADIDLINSEGNKPFPISESHQTNKFFYMDDWETSGWIGLGIESRLISFEFQMFALGGASQNANHRYYHIGHDSHPTWRMFLDFSIK